MSQLIDEFVQDHAALVETLGKIKTLGIRSTEGQEMIRAAKNSLLSHLKKEDERLYPVLKQAAKKDSDLKQTLEMFAKDMDGISKTALEFFDKYAKGGEGIEFVRDFGRLSATISQRMRREETNIYAKYNELVK